MHATWFGSALAGLLAVAGAATGQSNYTYLLTVDYGAGESSIHEDNPDATVRVWATREDGDYAWATGNLTMNAGEAGWTAFKLKLGFEGVFGRTAGQLSADQRAVTGIITGQFFDSLGDLRTDRPVLIWEGTWTNLSGDFEPRSINLFTSNTILYRVFVTNTGTTTSRLDQFTPGAGAITITPAPGAFGFTLFSGALAFARRRRDA